VLAMPRDELTHFIDRFVQSTWLPAASTLGGVITDVLRAAFRVGLVSLNASYVRLLTLDCPTVAAVNGHAIAGGALLALSADYRVAAAPGTHH